VCVVELNGESSHSGANETRTPETLEAVGVIRARSSVVDETSDSELVIVAETRRCVAMNALNVLISSAPSMTNPFRGLTSNTRALPGARHFGRWATTMSLLVGPEGALTRQCRAPWHWLSEQRDSPAGYQGEQGSEAKEAAATKRGKGDGRDVLGRLRQAEPGSMLAFPLVKEKS